MSSDLINVGEELTAAESWALLRLAVVGRLAVVVDERPDIFPVNHLVDRGSLVFRTAAGTKLAGALGHWVAFEVDGYDLETASAWSVVVKGNAREVTRLYDVLAAFELPLFPWHSSPKAHFIRIEPESVTGRRFQVTGGSQSSPLPGPIHHAADE
ncbi:MAG: pyridoxamine 5'-phosphate oxidase family protein [Dermatophilaceae bacterium]